MRTHVITPDALAARLAPLGDGGYCTRMAVAILLTPDDRGGLVGADTRTAQQLRLAATLALNEG